MAMKAVIVVMAIVVAALAQEELEFDLEAEWQKFKDSFDKIYEDVEEEANRMKIYLDNKLRIDKHNARFARGEVTFTVGINSLSDMLAHEVAGKMNGFRMQEEGRTPVRFEDEPQPRGGWPPLQWPWSRKTVDWRKKGYVTEVKDQGQCGSCWAFSSTGSLEGQMYKKTGTLVSLSEQNLVDCSTDYGNYGCGGGLMDQAFQYVKANGGIDTEESYPYTAQDGTCAFKTSSVGGTVTGFVDIHPSEKDLKNAVTKIGPISVAIDASKWTFQQYQGGIYYDETCSSTQLDHGVLLVGYGSDGWDSDYWIVKNSWGTSWGDQGYIKMARNRKNNCGIATQASYPTV